MATMRQFTRWLVRRVIRDHEQVHDPVVRGRYGSLEAWVSIVGNLLLFVVKLLAGLAVGSVALVADGVHTLTDTGTSLVILMGFHLAKKPADSEHPFGHGRTEAVAALIVAVLLMVTGLEVLRTATERAFEPVVSETVGWKVLLLLAGTIVVKELMARFAQELGRMIDSQALEGDFWHHRSDVLTSVVVLLALAAGRLGWAYVDGVAGMIVALVIVYSGYRVAREAVGPLLGQAPSGALLRRIEQVAMAHEGVFGVHDVIVHGYGQLQVVSLHIEVAADEPVGKLHDLSERVEESVGNALHSHAVVHIDPVNVSHPRYAEIRAAIAAQVADLPEVSGFHDVRLVGQGHRVNVIFDISLASPRAQRADQIVGALRQRLRQTVADARFIIKVEPDYSYSRGLEST